MWGRTFRRINNRSLSLRPFGLFAILTDRTGWSLAPATPTMTFYVPARRHQVTPVPVGYATAPNQELRRRDFHPLVQQPDSLHAYLFAEPPKAALLPECFSLHCYLRKPPWLLPAEATTVGWDSHPQGRRAFHGAREMTL